VPPLRSEILANSLTFALIRHGRCTFILSHLSGLTGELIDPTKAAALKDQGNKAFAAKDYDKAIDLFGQAIALDGSNHVLYSNRSAAYAGKKLWDEALTDADKVCSARQWYSANVNPVFTASLSLHASASKSTRNGRKDMPVRVLLCTELASSTSLLKHMRLVLHARTARHSRKA
jgi:tetratricopeptide (TPR) repeat protein